MDAVFHRLRGGEEAQRASVQQRQQQRAIAAPRAVPRTSTQRSHVTVTAPFRGREYCAVGTTHHAAGLIPLQSQVESRPSDALHCSSHAASARPHMKLTFVWRLLIVVAAFLPLLCSAVLPVHSSGTATAQHFEDWAPLQTLSDSVRFVAADTSMHNDGGSSARALEQHMADTGLLAAATEGVDWPPRMKLGGSSLRTLVEGDEQHYVQFATRVNDVTAAVFESLTGGALLSMVGDRAFVAVGCSAWAQRARAFPGVVFVAARGHHSKVSACLLVLPATCDA